MSNAMFNRKYSFHSSFIQRIPVPARSQSLRIALKFLLLLALLSFLLATAASATTYTVKAGGGGDFTTIQACATAMANGDTCTVFVGTYNEHVTVTAGGVASYKTLTVNPDDPVNVLDFTINSHVKINGFHITNPTSPNSSDCLTINANSTDFFITNNTFYACGFHAMIFEPSSGTSTGHGFVQGNTLSYSCSTSAAPNVCGGMQLYGSYHLIENNDISHVSDGFSNFDGDHNVIRNNTMHDTNTSDCGSNSSNCHIDFLETEPSVPPSIPSQFNVIEGNTELNNLGSDGHAWLAQSDGCNNQCHNLIIRFNIGAHVGSGGILDDNAGNSTLPGYSYVKSYNNTWIDYNSYNIPPINNQLYGGTNGFTHNSTNGAEINDLFYYPESLTDFNPYATDPSTVGTFSVGHNLAFCTGSPCNIHGKVYSSGNFTDDPGNIKADPLLVNYAGNNFHLSAGSPAIGAGTSLTTAVGSGSSSTSLTVADAAYFQDGYGIAGVQPDWIRVGASTTVQISSIDYSANVITLANAVSWNNSDPIYLYKNSTGTQVLFRSAPDLGALPF